MSSRSITETPLTCNGGYKCPILSRSRSMSIPIGPWITSAACCWTSAAAVSSFPAMRLIGHMVKQACPQAAPVPWHFAPLLPAASAIDHPYWDTLAQCVCPVHRKSTQCISDHHIDRLHGLALNFPHLTNTTPSLSSSLSSSSSPGSTLVAHPTKTPHFEPTPQLH